MSAWDELVIDSYEYRLKNMDDEGKAVETPYFWVFKAPTFSTERQVVMALREIKSYTTQDIMTEELYATFGGCNFPATNSPTTDPSESGFIPALEKGVSKTAFKQYLDTLPSLLVADLWAQMRRVAPHWGPDSGPRR